GRVGAGEQGIRLRTADRVVDLDVVLEGGVAELGVLVRIEFQAPVLVGRLERLQVRVADTRAGIVLARGFQRLVERTGTGRQQAVRGRTGDRLAPVVAGDDLVVPEPQIVVVARGPVGGVAVEVRPLREGQGRLVGRGRGARTIRRVVTQNLAQRHEAVGVG